MRLALIEASGNKIGGLTDTYLLFCFHYDPATGRYGLAVEYGALKIAGVLTLVGIAALIWLLNRRGGGKRGESVITNKNQAAGT